MEKEKKKKITNGPRSLQRTTTEVGPTLIPIVLQLGPTMGAAEQ
jgi:hypothetical protein